MSCCRLKVRVFDVCGVLEMRDTWNKPIHRLRFNEIQFEIKSSSLKHNGGNNKGWGAGLQHFYTNKCIYVGNYSKVYNWEQ